MDLANYQRCLGEINWLSIFINPLLLLGVEAFCLGILIMPIYIEAIWLKIGDVAISFLNIFSSNQVCGGLNIGAFEIGKLDNNDWLVNFILVFSKM